MAGKQEYFNTQTVRAKFADFPIASSMDGGLGVASDKSNAMYFSANGAWLPLAIFNPNGSLRDPATGNDIVINGPVIVDNHTTAYQVKATETGRTKTNRGAVARVDFTLPPPAIGLTYTFYCVNANGLRVIATDGSTIRISNTISAANGRYDTTAVGTTISLRCIDPGEWVAITFTGTGGVT